MSYTIKFLFLQVAYFALFCTSYVFANPVLKYRNFEITEIGAILTISAMFSIILQPIIARLINNHKKITNKLILICLMVLILISTIISYSTVNMIIIKYATITIITALLTSQTFIYTFIFEYINNGIYVNFGLTRGSGSVAFAITSLIVGIIADKSGYSFIGILNIILQILIIFLIINIRTFKEIHKVKKEKSISFFEFSKKYKKFMYLLVGIFFILTTHSGFSAYLINIAEEVNKGSSFVGFSFFFAAMLELPVMSFYDYFRKKYTNYNLFYLAMISFSIKAIITFIGVYTKSSNIILFAQFTQMFAFAIYLPASVFYVNRIMQANDRVSGQAYLGVAGTLGNILSGFLGAKLIHLFGVHYMVLVFTLISILGSIIVIYNLELDNNETK